MTQIGASKRYIHQIKHSLKMLKRHFKKKEKGETDESVYGRYHQVNVLTTLYQSMKMTRYSQG